MSVLSAINLNLLTRCFTNKFNPVSLAASRQLSLIVDKNISSSVSCRSLNIHLNTHFMKQRKIPSNDIWPRAFLSAESNSESGEKKPESTEESETVSESEKKLREEFNELSKKSDDLMDKYRRSLAESDNMRKRLTKQIEDAKVFGIQGFCKDLLEVADVLNKAVQSVPEETLEKESQYLKDMFEGLKLTETQLLQVFKRHGLEQENPMNEKFDPNKHEALFQIPNAEVEPNTVLTVETIGYILQGRTIRPAKVGVSKK